MRGAILPAGEQVILCPQPLKFDLFADRHSRLVSNFKLNWPFGLPLHDDRSSRHLAAKRDIPDPDSDQVAGSQLAVDGEIEQREITNPSSDLQADPDGPDLVSFQRRLLAGYLALVPRNSTCLVGEQVLHGRSPSRRIGELLLAKGPITALDPKRLLAGRESM